jgi:predicted DsbA family dithiol-disulfide isomerase
VVGYAKELGLDVARFKTDLKTCVAAVNADDTEAGARFAIQGTPTFFINGRVITGAVPVQYFVTLIDEEMTKATDRIKKGTPKARYYKAWVVGKGEKTVAP